MFFAIRRCQSARIERARYLSLSAVQSCSQNSPNEVQARSRAALNCFGKPGCLRLTSVSSASADLSFSVALRTLDETSCIDAEYVSHSLPKEPDTFGRFDPECSSKT